MVQGMKTVALSEAKDKLSSLVDEAEEARKSLLDIM
jgi:PHD/YefM family antitoxin component YafN of YafNO toxin-antitoxin module